MSQVLMPKATAVWLIENTALTFAQVAEFCGLHPLEVQSIANDEIAVGMVGFDPISNGQLTKEEIERCQVSPDTRLVMAEANVPRPTTRTKGPRYTPVAMRQDKPDAIAWLVKNFPELSDGQLGRLVGTTKPTIAAVRDRTHWNINNIKPRDPVALGLVAREDLTAEIEKTRRAKARAEKKRDKEKAASAPAIVAEPVADNVSETASLETDSDAGNDPVAVTADDVFGRSDSTPATES